MKNSNYEKAVRSPNFGVVMRQVNWQKESIYLSSFIEPRPSIMAQLTARSSSKLKTNLLLAIQRIKLVAKKKAEIGQKFRREIADYLVKGL